MGEIIVKKVVKRENGYIYYVDGEGNVCRALKTQPKKVYVMSPPDENFKPKPRKPRKFVQSHHPIIRKPQEENNTLK